MARRKKDPQLEEILEEIPEDRRYIGEKLCTEIIFMTDTLGDLRRSIKENGTEEIFEQGSQKFTRESSALSSYNKLVGQYTKACKQLIDLMPAVDAKGFKDTKLGAFLK